jgi:hypothetical protein
MATEREAAAASERELPPLPQEAWGQMYCNTESAYRADQMRTYALAAVDAALSRAPQAVRVPLTEEQIIAVLAKAGIGWADPDNAKAPVLPFYNDGDCDEELRIARAIEAAHGIVPLAPQEEGGKKE